ncbi:MAG: hypothetical protein JOY82_01165 [Streptosporangiaceae bacterium]|nr:hypothetical protein [Streptosporangiaceae bacterium]
MKQTAASSSVDCVAPEDLYALARKAARTAAGRQVFSREECFDIAWEAIAEKFCSSGGLPAGELVQAGMDAIRAEYAELRHHHGIPKGFTSRDGTKRERYVTYWYFHAGVTNSHEDKVVDSIALAQIWPKLTVTQREAIAALARHRDITSAARSLGKSHATFRSQLRQARKLFFALWHEHEKPSRKWMSDRPANPERRQLTISTNLRRRRKQRQARKSSPAPAERKGRG